MGYEGQLKVYTWVWILYQLQGIIYPAGLIGQMLFLIIMAYSIFVMMNVIALKNKPKIFTFLTLLVVLYSIYGILRIIQGPVRSVYVEDYSTLTYIKTYLLSLSPIYVFYYFSYKNALNEDWFRKYAFVFLIMSIMIYLHNQLQVRVLTGNDEITNNAAYGFVALLPLSLFWYKKPIIQYILIGVAAIFTLVSMKRGAILVFAISVIPILVASLKNSKAKTKFLAFVGIFAFVYITYTTVEDLISTSDLFALRLEQTLEGQSSNRDIIYEELWAAYKNYDPFEAVFGRGADASIAIAGKLAHNDWLETLIDQGLLGTLVFLLFWLSMLRTYFKYEKNSVVSTALLVIFLSSFSRTWFSMSIGQMPIYFTAVLGYCLLKENKKENLKSIKI